MRIKGELFAFIKITLHIIKKNNTNANLDYQCVVLFYFD
jgi:aromatic ring-opening dioxygenase LigB subunit